MKLGACQAQMEKETKELTEKMDEDMKKLEELRERYH